MSEKKMSRMQKRFCEEYLVDCNGAHAAIRAGYNPKTAKVRASQLLKIPAIRERIDEELERIHNERTADAEEVMEYLTSVMRGEKKEQVLALDGDGKQKVIEVDVPMRERVKCAELIGKRYGMFTGNFEVNGGVKVVFVGDLKDDIEGDGWHLG